MMDLFLSLDKKLKRAAETGDVAELTRLLTRASLPKGRLAALEAAVISGKVESVRLLLGHDQNLISSLPAVAGEACLWRRDLPMLEALLDNGWKPQPHATRHVLSAMEQGNAAFARVLVDRSELRDTSLAAAARASNEGAVTTLLGWGANPEANEGDALRGAIESGSTDIFDLIAAASPGIASRVPGLLGAAIRRGDASLLDKAIKAGANPKKGDALTEAITAERRDFVDMLISAGAPVDFSNSGLLEAALECSDETLLPHLASRCAKPNAGKGAALRAAIEYNRVDAIEALVKAGAKANMLDFASLETAADQKDCARMIQLLGEAGADLDMNEGRLLCQAVENSHHSLAAALISAGADPNAGDGAPLKTAIEQGYVGMLALLIEGGGDVNIDRGALFGQTDDTEIRAFLLARGLDLKRFGDDLLNQALTDEDDDRIAELLRGGVDPASPVMPRALRAALSNDNARLARDLIARGALKGVADPAEFLTATFDCDGNAELVRLIFKNGAKPDSPAAQSALKQAAEDENTDVVHALLEAGVTGGWAVMKALMELSDENVALHIFLSRGADPDMENGKPLMHAVKSDTALVAALLAHGADPMIRKGAAVALARRNGDTHMVGMLEGHAAIRDLKRQKDKGHRAQEMADLRRALHGGSPAPEALDAAAEAKDVKPETPGP
jgi:ankyrin repeat protein